MNGRFWASVCRWPATAHDTAQMLPPLGPWLAGPAASQLVVEVLKFIDGRRVIGHAVLLSRMIGRPERLRCDLGFTNRIRFADHLRERGVRMVEAPINATVAGGTWAIEVQQPLAGGAPGHPASGWMIRIEGVRFEVAQGPTPMVPTRFDQIVASPALVGTDQNLSQTELNLRMERSKLTKPTLPANAQVLFRNRFAQPLPVGPSTSPVRLARSGRFLLPELAPPPRPVAAAASAAAAAPRPVLPPRPANGPLRVVQRQAAFTPTGFRFDDVELFGFRIDLPQEDRSQRLLEVMLDRLNFHRLPHAQRPGWGSQAFRFRPASLSVAVELLRYGRMYWGEDPRPRHLWPADEPYTSQHELLLRILVGRVDDASVQACDPALYVPAIFVDNPWSKLIGRELQGFKKRLASFCVDGQPLALDGFLPGQTERMPLAKVNRVCALDAIGGTPGKPLLELELPPSADDGRPWVDLGDVVLDTARDAWRSARWRQRHFADEEFRREFARDVLTQRVDRLQSIQVTPVDLRGLPSAWITGTFGFDELQAVQPDGVATLTLGDGGGDCPQAWGLLTSLLPGGRVSLPTGDWYHARGSMRMTIGRGFV
ncbi:MAG: hypothetical protein RJA10_4417 [Pseudomonadota bacterium]|jgi:hypothetical protein